MTTDQMKYVEYVVISILAIVIIYIAIIMISVLSSGVSVDDDDGNYDFNKIVIIENNESNIYCKGEMIYASYMFNILSDKEVDQLIENGECGKISQVSNEIEFKILNRKHASSGFNFSGNCFNYSPWDWGSCGSDDLYIVQLKPLSDFGVELMWTSVRNIVDPKEKLATPEYYRIENSNAIVCKSLKSIIKEHQIDLSGNQYADMSYDCDRLFRISNDIPEISDVQIGVSGFSNIVKFKINRTGNYVYTLRKYITN